MVVKMAAKNQPLKEFDSKETHHKLHTRSGKVAILFTDIKGSTAIWEKLGDTEARQLVEKHNRLLFPIVKKCRGKVIKTIGDSIMAKFRSPHKALKAAVAMQQILNSERSKSDFPIHIRIGIHYGRGIIEAKDVYGDLVNTAARIEGKARGDQILLSAAVKNAISRRHHFSFKSARKFTPKGKTESIPLYSCDWKSSPYLPDRMGIGKSIPLSTGQKGRLFFYFLTTSVGLFFLFNNYLRFLIADTTKGALFFVAPKEAIMENIFPLSAMLTGLLFLLWILIKNRFAPLLFLRIIKGGFIGTVLCALTLLVAPQVKIDTPMVTNLSENVYATKHFFVRVKAEDVNIRLSPPQGQVLRQASMGNIFLLQGTTRKAGITYNRIWLGKGSSGYIPRVLPPKVGVPAKRLTYTDRFYLKGWDILAAISGLLGFLFGAILFKVRPL